MAIVEDLDAFLADFGVPCVFGSSSFVALLDQEDDVLELPRAGTLSRQYAITFRTSQASLTRGQAGTVNGVAYTVREAPRQVDDGAFSRCTLTRT